VIWAMPFTLWKKKETRKTKLKFLKVKQRYIQWKVIIILPIFDFPYIHQTYHMNKNNLGRRMDEERLINAY
jgi:intracellular septation protein A